MNTITSRLVSAFYWLAAWPLAMAGILVGLVYSLLESGFKTGRDLHRGSIDIWDSRYNDP